MKKVVIFTGLVKLNKNLVGTAIIYHCLASFLNKANFHVSLVLPEQSDYQLKGVDYHLYHPQHNRRLINQSHLVIFGAYPPLEPLQYAHAQHKIIITYLWSIAPLGSLEFKDFRDLRQQMQLHQSILSSYNSSLQLSDKIFCRSQQVKDLVLGSLISLGRANLLNYRPKRNFDDLLELAPFGLPATPPKHQYNVYRRVVPNINPADYLLIWNGGVWNWHDACHLVKTMQLIWQRNKKIKLIFQGFHNPDKIYSLEAQRARKLADRLKLADRNIFFPDNWINYDDRGNFLTEADAGIVSSANIPETNYFIKTRFYDYLWAELPVILNQAEAFAAEVAKHNLGLVLSGQLQSDAAQIIKFVDHQKLHRQIKKNIQVYKKNLTWSKTLKPIINYCLKAKSAPDKVNLV